MGRYYVEDLDLYVEYTEQQELAGEVPPHYVQVNEDGSLGTNPQADQFKKYLKDTDWYAVRLVETGKPIPEDILQARKLAREYLSR